MFRKLRLALLMLTATVLLVGCADGAHRTSLPGTGLAALTSTDAAPPAVSVPAERPASEVALVPAATNTWSLTVPGRAETRFTLQDVPAGFTLVYLKGDGSTDLDVYVRDGHDQLVGSDEGPGDEAYVTMELTERGDLQIRVRNVGTQPNTCKVMLGVNPG